MAPLIDPPVMATALAFCVTIVPNVPAATLFSDEATTFVASVVPVKVDAAAGTVILAVPSKLIPLMLRGVAKAVAVPALPVIPPVIGLVTVRLVRLWVGLTENSLELRTSPVPAV